MSDVKEKIAAMKDGSLAKKTTSESKAFTKGLVLGAGAGLIVGVLTKKIMLFTVGGAILGGYAGIRFSKKMVHLFDDVKNPLDKIKIGTDEDKEGDEKSGNGKPDLDEVMGDINEKMLECERQAASIPFKTEADKNNFIQACLKR